jgi:hypothetical protein
LLCRVRKQSRKEKSELLVSGRRYPTRCSRIFCYIIYIRKKYAH